MRKFALLAAVLGLFSFSAAAQDYPNTEFFGGYQFTHLDPNVQLHSTPSSQVKLADF